MSPPRPEGSRIEQREEFEGPLLSWPLPPPAPNRPIFLAILAFWTCAWAVGLAPALLSFIRNPDGGLLLWLISWAVCGGWAPIFLRAALRRRPESVLLCPHSLTHDRGWDMYSPPILSGLLSGTFPLLPRGPVVVPRECRFVLETVGERQVLSVEHAGDRVEIGAYLGDQDKEWLYRVLGHWRRD
jgi:hypothetical protein